MTEMCPECMDDGTPMGCNRCGRIKKETRVNPNTTAAAPVERSQVDYELGELHQTVDTLEGRLDGLTTRLTSVLRHEDASVSQPMKPGGDDVLVGVAESIRQARRRVDCFVHTVDTLVERLEN